MKKIFNTKICTLILKIGFVASLIPIVMLSAVNRASGDDYGYGILTRAAWRQTHSLMALCQAIGNIVKEYYYGWQGTWFDIVLFSLQPEVFSDKAYWIVVPMMLFLWIGTTCYFFQELLIHYLGFEKRDVISLIVIFLMISIQWIPSTKSSLFWFNGCAHYMIPFTMCQMVFAWGLKYVRSQKIKYFIGATVFMTLLGGANYQAALFSMIGIGYLMVASYLMKKNKKFFLFLIPLGLEAIGLFISMKAPGNKIRGGQEFGFSLKKVLETIIDSFLYGIKDIGTYAKERPLIFVGLLFLGICIWNIYWKDHKQNFIKGKIVWAILLFCIYSAMQAPAIYAGVEVSRGVLNTNYQIFLLTATGLLLLMIEGIVIKLKQSVIDTNKIKNIPIVIGIIICILGMEVFRSNVRDSTFYVCLTYITSGQAADYKEQMDLQTKLLEEEGVEEVELPFINDIQGPLMHMPVTENPEAWTNMVTRRFYGKKSVVAMERALWEAKYQGKE